MFLECVGLALQILLVVKGSAGDCAFSINTDMDSKSPIVYVNHQILLPEKSDGVIKVGAGQTIWLACPGRSNYVVATRSQEIAARCSSGRSFYITSQLRPEDIKNIDCKDHPQSYATGTNRRCVNNGEVIEIGFALGGRSVPQMYVCFDANDLTTHVAYKVNENGPHVNVCPRTSHSFKVDLFGNSQPSRKYQRANQLARDPMIRADNLFEKGHLVPRCDFFTGAQQRATYYYLNAVPQFRSFNQGNWKLLEARVRRNFDSGYAVYTGTYGVLTSPYTGKRVSLAPNGEIPAPEIFWKIVHKPQADEGVAFLGINNPYVDPIVTRCPSVCGQVQWLKEFETHRQEKSNGYVYCCTIQEFMLIPNMTHYLPQLATFSGGLLVHAKDG